MLTTKKIITKTKNMKFFDSSLTVFKDKVDAIKPSDEKSIQRFEDELRLTFKLKTIHIWNTLFDTYDILVNPKQIMTKQEYKFKCTNKDNADDTGAVVGYGCYMSNEEWENYEKAYFKLLKK